MGASLPPILVTGAHRTGTTWTGRMLSLHRQVGYIHEPFNPVIDGGIHFPRAYTYICDENEGAYLEGLRDLIEFRYRVGENFERYARTKKSLRTMLTLLGSTLKRRLTQVRPLVKDPLASFSSEWMARRFDMQVVVCVRHPAAFASSLKVNDYRFPFDQLLAQPLLLRDLLRPFLGEIVAYAADPPPIVDQAALVWRMVYAALEAFHERHPEWIFVRHEDLSLDPVGGFRSLYERLRLPWDDRIEASIRWHSGDESAEAPPGLRQFTKVRRASVDNLQTWRRRLTADEAARLRDKVGPAAERYYSAGEWGDPTAAPASASRAAA